MNLFDGEKLMTKATLMRTPSGTRFTMQATVLLNTFVLNHISFRNGNVLCVVFSARYYLRIRGNCHSNLEERNVVTKATRQ